MTNRTVFRRGLYWYIAPRGNEKVRWWKSYVQIPPSTQYWANYMSIEERNKLLDIYEDSGYGALVEACTYLSSIWAERSDIAEDARKERGKARLEDAS